MARRHEQPGFTLVEVLLSLAIMALLLTAAGVAVHASMMNHEESGELATAAQATRVLCERMARDCRTASAIDFSAPDDTLRLVPPTGDHGITQIEYAFDADQSALLYRLTTGEGTEEHVLIGGEDDIEVSAFYVMHQTEWDAEAEEWYVRNVTMELTFSVDNQTFTVTASAVPRRSQSY